MELIVGIIIVALLSKKIIKSIVNTIIFILILGVSIVVSFVYDIPYFFSVCICTLVKYGIRDCILSIKDLCKVLITSKNKYKHGSLEKFVSILINCNFVLFILLTYYFIINKLISDSIVISSSEVILISGLIIIIISGFRKILTKILGSKLLY